jgi:hypothetical protein
MPLHEHQERKYATRAACRALAGIYKCCTNVTAIAGRRSPILEFCSIFRDDGSRFVVQTEALEDGGQRFNGKLAVLTCTP